MAPPTSLQQRFAPGSICFGCGPANPRGLRIGSFPSAERPEVLECRWQPEAHHEAFPGMLNGGIAGALLDCHSNWAAAWHLMQSDGLDAPPVTVTADFHVRMRRPTPTTGPLLLRAWPTASEGERVTVAAELETDGVVTATCEGRFVRVRPGHPAYHSW